ncbi:MAG: DUF11 domain-containing protein, partial [Parapedobacter sp.]
MKKLYQFRSTFIVALCFLFSFSSAFADGSKDLYPEGVQGHRASLRVGTSVTVNYPFPSSGTHYVYAESGETITLASSAQQSGSSRIRLFGPSGSEISLAISGSAGYIANRTQELAGPAKPAGASPVNAYTPIYHTVTETGIYRVEFIGYGTGTAGVADGPWTNGTSSDYVNAWDVSVYSAVSADFISGRVYANVFNLSANGTGQVFHGVVNVLTKDGYVYRVNANGMTGYLFTFFVNNNGFTYAETDAPIYQSLTTTSLGTIASDGYYIHNPNTADTETHLTHKMFYTLPADDLPATGVGAVPGGTTWLRNEPVEPDVSNVEVTGVDGTPGQVSNKGGYISFSADAQGQYTIEIESPDNTFTTRVLRGPAVTGTNQVYWDGEDGDGNPLPEGNVPATISVQLQGAEVHFPYFDVEYNLNGIIIELLDKDNLNNVASDLVYWDDSPISTTTGASNPKNNSHLPPTNSPGISSNGNGHKFGTTTSEVFGNERSLDTWTFILGAKETVSTNVVVNIADLEVASITSDYTGNISVGDEWTYTSVIYNHGPSAVATNTDPDLGPITQGARFRLYVPDGVTIDTDPLSISFTSDCATLVGTPTFVDGIFEAIVDMPAECEATIAVSAEATGAITENNGNVYVWSTILRPNDYTDINATNPDPDIPPTDPFFEADGINAEYTAVAAGDPTLVDLTRTNNIKLNGDLVMVADLAITKAVSAGPWQVYTPVTFTLTVVNNGPSDATGVVVSDLLPDGYLFVSSNPSTGSYDDGTGEWTIGDLSADAGSNTATLSIVAEVQPTGNYTNTATISSDVSDDDLTNNEDEAGVVTPAPAEADLAVEKIVDNNRPVVGDEVTFTITVTNNGPSRATGVTVQDVMLDGYAVTGVTVEAGTWNAPDWTIPSLLNGQSYEMTITAEVLASGTIDNTATVDANEDDPDASNNTDEVLVELAAPELTVTKTITSAGPYNTVGQEITYDIVVTNTGNVTIDNIVLTDANADIPAGDENIGTLNPAESVTITVTHEVTLADLNSGSVSNQATAAGDDPDGDPVTEDSDDPGTPDPNDPTDTDVVQTPELTVTKTITSAGPYNAVGDVITYDIIVTNTGNVTIDNIVLTDANADIPAGEENIGTLDPTESATITVTHTVTQTDLNNGSVSNQATATGDDPDGDPVTDDSDDPGTPDPNDPTDTDVVQAPELTVTKTITSAGPYEAVGDVITYDIVVTNTGNVTI